MTTATQKIPSGYKQTEIGVIPADWDVKKLGDLGEIKMCRRIFSHETKEVGTIPFYKIGTFGKEADAYIPQDLYDDYRHRFSFPKKGDILISAAGTIGRTIVYDGIPAYFQDSNIVWIDNNEELISNGYLYYVFQIVKYNTEGGTIQRLYNSIIKGAKFICPTKPQQNAIISILSDTDILIEKLEKLLEKKKSIKQGVMQELLTGKRRLAGFTDKWELRRLDDIFRVTRGQVLAMTKTTKYKIGDYQYPVYSSQTKENGLAGYYKNYLFENCITWTTDGANAGDVKYRPGKFYCTNVCGVLESNEGYANLCIASIFNSVSRKYVSYIGNPKLMNNVVADIAITIPSSVKEQVAISEVISDMDTEIEKLESQLTKYQNIKQGMMQTLLTGKIRLLTK
jgi:type I restriction enzyme S subunit